MLTCYGCKHITTRPCGDEDVIHYECRLTSELTGEVSIYVNSEPQRCDKYDPSTSAKKSISGKEIRLIRKMMGWTAQQLADHLGTSRTSVTQWETEDRHPNDRYVQILLNMKDDISKYRNSINIVPTSGSTVPCINPVSPLHIHQDKLFSLLSKGNYPQTACKAIGLSYWLYQDWMRKGEQGIEPYYDFYLAANKALAEGETHHIAILHEAGSLDWRASAKFLEMRWTDRFNRQVTTIEHIFSKLTDEQLEEAHRQGQNALQEMEKNIIAALTEAGMGEIVEGEIVNKKKKEAEEGEENV